MKFPVLTAILWLLISKISFGEAISIKKLNFHFNHKIKTYSKNDENSKICHYLFQTINCSLFSFLILDEMMMKTTHKIQFFFFTGNSMTNKKRSFTLNKVHEITDRFQKIFREHQRSKMRMHNTNNWMNLENESMIFICAMETHIQTDRSVSNEEFCSFSLLVGFVLYDWE